MADEETTEAWAPFSEEAHTDHYGSLNSGGDHLAPGVMTPPGVVRQMLKLTQVGPEDVLLDVGCGDGDIVVEAALTGARAIGIDLFPERVEKTLALAAARGVSDRVTAEVVDARDWEGWSQASVIVLCLLPKALKLFLPTVREALARGARVITYLFPLPDVVPASVDVQFELFLYKEAPAADSKEAPTPAQAEFPKNQWGHVKKILETEGPAAVLAFVARHEDPQDRRKLHLFVTQALHWQDWEGKTLDACVQVAEGAMGEMLRQATSETDPEAAGRYTDLANVVSYNLAAKLADCWDDTDTPRQRHHFERGLQAAEECIRWRMQLGKGAGPLSAAYWAKGMHQLSLGDAASAVTSFTTSQTYAEDKARASGDASAEPSRHFAVALGQGYAGVAQHVAGDVGGKARFQSAMASFEKMAQDPENKDDAEVGIDQLRVVWSRYGERM